MQLTADDDHSLSACVTMSGKPRPLAPQKCQSEKKLDREGGRERTCRGRDTHGREHGHGLLLEVRAGKVVVLPIFVSQEPAKAWRCSASERTVLLAKKEKRYTYRL
jgi:hypothetical protein